MSARRADGFLKRASENIGGKILDIPEFLKAVAKTAENPSLKPRLWDNGVLTWALPDGRIQLIADKEDYKFNGVILLKREVEKRVPEYLWHHGGSPLWCSYGSSRLDEKSAALVAAIVDYEFAMAAKRKRTAQQHVRSRAVPSLALRGRKA